MAGRTGAIWGFEVLVVRVRVLGFGVFRALRFLGLGLHGLGFRAHPKSDAANRLLSTTPRCRS